MFMYKCLLLCIVSNLINQETIIYAGLDQTLPMTISVIYLIDNHSCGNISQCALCHCTELAGSSPSLPHSGMGHRPLVLPRCLADQERQILLLHKVKVWSQDFLQSISRSHLPATFTFIAPQPVLLQCQHYWHHTQLSTEHTSTRVKSAHHTCRGQYVCMYQKQFSFHFSIFSLLET